VPLISGIARAIAVERALKFADAPVTASMLTAMVIWGPVGCYIVGFALDFVFAAIVLELHLQSIKRFGVDVIGIADIRKSIYGPVLDEQLVGGRIRRLWQRSRMGVTRALKSVAGRILGSYWMMIFFGSMISYLEPDYVTLFLRKEEEGRISVLTRVTLPAVAWSIGIWTGIYWCAVQGFSWAVTFV